ncbi:unnamed protein product [Victoria cruziana]
MKKGRPPPLFSPNPAASIFPFHSAIFSRFFLRSRRLQHSGQLPTAEDSCGNSTAAGQSPTGLRTTLLLREVLAPLLTKTAKKTA